MIDRVRTLFASLGRPAPAEVADAIDPLHLAAAALLAVVALGDAEYAEAERATIERLVRDRFDLDDEAASALLAAAEQAARDATHLLRFTRAVKDGFSPDERVALIEMIWEVALADGHLDAHEDALLRRIAGLIYVSDRDRGAARKRAEARLAARTPSPRA